MSVWNPDNIRDVAESVGIVNLTNDVTENLARDVEYRIAQVLEEALKFMRHSRRTLLTTQDVAQALRVLDVEPLYGYETTRPLRFGEASLGPGQPLFYVEDEEVDFEKLINAPLPKVPREISFTGEKPLQAVVLGLCFMLTGSTVQLIGWPLKVCSRPFRRILPLPTRETSN
jgi:transcription initiation factor TFIID subunit 6